MSGSTRNTQERRAVMFCALCCFVYFASYITRINYGAAMAEIVVALNVSKALAGMVVTGSFCTYGIGQVVSGILGDRVRPSLMIFLGMLITSLCNIAMPLLGNMYAMAAVWSLNGFAQSMIWPAIVRVMAENLSPAQYKRACVAVSIAASIATIAIYLIIPLCISLAGWRSVFALSALCGLLAAAVWRICINRLAVTPGSMSGCVTATSATPIENAGEGGTAPPSGSLRSLVFATHLGPVFLVVMAQGILRDSITTWMPSYISDTFQLDTSLSILSAVVLPLLSIISIMIAPRVYALMKNEVRASVVIWILALLCAVALLFTFASHMAVSVLLMAVITGCMHGINLMLISILPVRYGGYGRISTVSGLLNAFTYIGSAISTYGIAALSDGFGWNATVVAWCGVALVGTVVCTVCAVRRLPRVPATPF